MPIVTDGLIGYWNAKQGVNGSTWDNIAPATVGQYNGAITGATLQADGVYHDGIDDFFTAPCPPIANIRYFTLELLMTFNPSLYSAATEALGFDSSNTMLVQGNRFDFKRRGGSLLLTPSGSLSSGYKMYHLVLTYDGATYRAYVDNAPFSKSDTLRPVDNPLNIRFNNTKNINGLVHAMRLYGRTLTAEEVSQNYASGTEVGLDAEPPPSGVVEALDSTTQATSSASGNLKIRTSLYGTAQQVSTATGNLRNHVKMESSTVGDTAASGTLKASVPLSGSSEDVNQTTPAPLYTQVRLAGESESTSETFTAALHARVGLSGESQSTSTSQTAALHARVSLSGESISVSEAVLYTSQGSEKALSGSSEAESTSMAKMTRKRAIAASEVAGSTSNGRMNRKRDITSSEVIQSATKNVQITRSRSVSGASTADTLVSATLRKLIRIQASSSAPSTAWGTVKKVRSLYAISVADAVTEAVQMKVDARMYADTLIDVYANARLGRNVYLFAEALAVSEAYGKLALVISDITAQTHLYGVYKAMTNIEGVWVPGTTLEGVYMTMTNIEGVWSPDTTLEGMKRDRTKLKGVVK